MESNGSQSKPVFLGEGFVAGHITIEVTKGFALQTQMSVLNPQMKARLVCISDKNVVSKVFPIPDRIIDLERLTHRESNE